MDILIQLGINKTLFIQMIIFLVGFVALYTIVFSPYYKAAEERQNKTVGSEEAAVELDQKKSELNLRYEAEAKEVNSQIKTIYDNYREQAQKEYQGILAEAKKESQNLIDKNRKSISDQINTAVTQLKNEIPQVAKTIKEKVLNKGV